MNTQEYIEGIDALIEDGEIEANFKESKLYKSKLVNFAIKDKLIVPSNDNAGDWGTRAKASFLDEDDRKMKYLESKYGEGNVFNADGQWIYKDGKNWNNFDSEDTEIADFTADIAGDAVEMIPPIAAETAGYLATKNPATASLMGGAALGFSSDAKDQLGEYLTDIPLGKTNSDRAVDGIGEGSIGAIGGLVGLKAGEGVYKLLNPNKSKYFSQAVQERINQALSQNVKLTPAQALQSKKLGWMEDQMKHFGITADDWAKWLEKNQTQPINDKIAQLSPKTDNSQIGELIKKALGTNKKQIKKQLGARYDELGDKAGIVNNENTLKNALNIIEEQKNIPPSARNQAYTTAKEIADGAMVNIKGNPVLSSKDVSYKEAKHLRSSMGNNANKNIGEDDALARDYLRLKDGVSKDINDQFLKSGSANEAKALNGDFSTYSDTYKNNTIKKMLGTGRKDPLDDEKVVNTFFKPLNETPISKIQKATNNPELIDDALMQGVLNKAKDVQGGVSHRKFATQAHKMKPELKMHTKSNQIEDLTSTIDSTKFSDEFVNNSKTAYATGNNYLGGLGQILSVIPRTFTSKAYLRPATQKWLTSGAMSGDGSMTNAIGGGSGLLLSPEKENTPILGKYLNR